MTLDPSRPGTGRRLIFLGFLLFLLGLLTGLAGPLLANPRMGLSAHLEGLMNGMFLVLLGLVWPRLRLSRRVLAFAFWTALYGAFVNWGTTLLAACLGAGGTMMPIASMGRKGTPLQEGLINFGLISLSFAVLICCVLLLWGLSGPDESRAD